MCGFYIYCFIFNYFAAMFKRFRIVCLILLCGMVLFSCVKKPTKKEVEENLKTAMEQFLNHQPRI